MVQSAMGSILAKGDERQREQEQDSTGANMEDIRHVYEVVFTRLYIRSEPSIRAAIVKTESKGAKLAADKRAGPWVRVVRADSARTSLTADVIGWALLRHHEHGHLLNMIED